MYPSWRLAVLPSNFGPRTKYIWLYGLFTSRCIHLYKVIFLLFCVSALFGKVMEETGAAAAIAKWLTKLLGEKFAILGVFFAGMLLTYGGISALVIAFTMYPIALAVFKSANLPRRLIPGVIAAGCSLRRLHFRVSSDN